MRKLLRRPTSVALVASLLPPESIQNTYHCNNDKLLALQLEKDQVYKVQHSAADNCFSSFYMDDTGFIFSGSRETLAKDDLLGISSPDSAPFSPLIHVLLLTNGELAATITIFSGFKGNSSFVSIKTVDKGFHNGDLESTENTISNFSIISKLQLTFHLVLLSEKDLCDRMEKPVSKEAPRVPFIQEVQHGTPSEPLTSERPPDTGPLLLPHS
ncbi:hypothetical protein E5288_WYG009347 [Bos mutus]|uniref:Uncharacterized protein n=1 Tax=Bos mutus TaxID=72004 RepID=A0A6B0S0X7_9CETA|nr:hypothetical protein [Bos mutus]